MQGEPYQAELRVIRLDGSSIILGIDWLKAYGKVTFDYNDNSVTFSRDSKQTTLKGIIEGSKLQANTASLKVITAERWYKAGVDGNCCAIGRYIPTEMSEEEGSIPREIQQVLEQYKDVF